MIEWVWPRGVAYHWPRVVETEPCIRPAAVVLKLRQNTARGEGMRERGIVKIDGVLTSTIS